MASHTDAAQPVCDVVPVSQFLTPLGCHSDCDGVGWPEILTETHWQTHRTDDGHLRSLLTVMCAGRWSLFKPVLREICFDSNRLLSEGQPSFCQSAPLLSNLLVIRLRSDRALFLTAPILMIWWTCYSPKKCVGAVICSGPDQGKSFLLVGDTGKPKLICIQNEEDKAGMCSGESKSSCSAVGTKLIAIERLWVRKFRHQICH